MKWRVVAWILVGMAGLGGSGCGHGIKPADRRASFEPYRETLIGEHSASHYLLRRTALLVNEHGGVGTATAIDRRGYFLTAAHCVGRHAVRLVVWQDGVRHRVVPARVVWRGDLDGGEPDLALVRTTVPVNEVFAWSADVERGQTVLVCGPDYEEVPEKTYQLDCIAGKVTLLGELAREGGRVRTFRHDAPVHPGDSGGPVVDLNGRLIGINYATARLVLVPPLSWRMGVLASRPDRDWLQALIEDDQARLPSRRPFHSTPATPAASEARRER